MGYLIGALAAPLAGPLLYRVLHRHDRARHLVDGFVFLAVPLLVTWQVGSTAWSERSLVPLAAVGAGLLIPAAMERASHALERHTDDLAILVALSGLVFHAALEGAALAPWTGGVAAGLGVAVILHRLPVGLVIWWLVRPRHGVPKAILAVSAVVLATVAGAVVGAEVLGAEHGRGFEIFQAGVAGSLIHVVFHQGRHDHDHGEEGGHAHHHADGEAKDHPHGHADHRHEHSADNRDEGASGARSL